MYAELFPKGQFRIHTPGRTYYLEDVRRSCERTKVSVTDAAHIATQATGDSSIAELWVQTICHLQARPTPPVARAPVRGWQLSPWETRRSQEDAE